MAVLAEIKRSHERRISLNSPIKENYNIPVGFIVICDFARNCPFRYLICNICEKRHKETKCKSKTAAPNKNQVTTKKGPSVKF